MSLHLHVNPVLLGPPKYSIGFRHLGERGVRSHHNPRALSFLTLAVTTRGLFTLGTNWVAS